MPLNSQINVCPLKGNMTLSLINHVLTEYRTWLLEVSWRSNLIGRLVVHQRSGWCSIRLVATLIHRLSWNHQVPPLHYQTFI